MRVGTNAREFAGSRRSLTVAIALVALVLACGELAGAAEPLDPVAAVHADAAEYANAFDVSSDEALRRLALQDEAIPSLAAVLAESFPKHYAGLYIEHRPEFRVVVRMTAGGPTDVTSFISDFRLLGDLDVVSVEYSLAELAFALDRVLDARRETGIALDAEIDVRSNRVVVDLPKDGSDTEAALIKRTVETRAPETADLVDYRVVPSLSQPALDIFGGLRLTNPSTGASCTSGFSIRHNSSMWLGITTAAHCDKLSFVRRVRPRPPGRELRRLLRRAMAFSRRSQLPEQDL